MKKRLLLFAILFFGLCGCDKDNGEDVDPPGIGHFVWVNASDHRITMTVNGQFEDEIMLPGERISKTMIGFIALPPSPDLYVMHGIEIVFDDGPYGGVFQKPKEYPPCPLYTSDALRPGHSFALTGSRSTNHKKTRTYHLDDTNTNQQSM